MRYRIHACKQRMWYVDGYLVPSLRAQGVPDDAIDVWLDKDEVGCLDSCMRSFGTHDDPSDGTWYMQDDVIICHDFKERAEANAGDMLVNAFCSKYCGDYKVTGVVPVKQMWFSFPCFYMPNRIALACNKWFYGFCVLNTQYRMWVRAKKYDDSIFWIFMQDFSGEREVINLAPNMVDHVDWLIGGSVINKTRSDQRVRSMLWEDERLVYELTEQLRKDGRYDN